VSPRVGVYYLVSYPPYAGTLILAYAGYAKSALYWLCSCYTMLVLHTSILGF